MHVDTTALVASVLCTAECDHARNGLSGNNGTIFAKFFNFLSEMVSLGILSSFCA